MSAIIRVNVGNDVVTGKKVKMDLVRMTTNSLGQIISIFGNISFFEVDNTTPAIPAANTQQAKRVVSPVEDQYYLEGRFIDSVTKLYVAGLVDGLGVAIPNAIALVEYIETKVITSFPGVAGSDNVANLNKGILKEIIAIRQANGELMV